MLLNAPRLLLVLMLLGCATEAWGDTTQSSEALARFEERIAMRMGEAGSSLPALQPVIVVSASPAWEASRAWYPTEALKSLTRAFGGGSGVRFCEACMAPRLTVTGGRLEQNTSALSVDEIIRLDAQSRGDSPPARAAVWLDETPQGVSFRMVDLSNSRLLAAENFDPELSETTRTAANFSMAREVDRRAQGESHTHLFVDAVVYPGQHLSLDVVEQWGAENRNLLGVSFSVWDPSFGLGPVYYRIFPEAWNIMAGAQVMVSLPVTLGRRVLEDQKIKLHDPPVTGVGIVRVPFGSSNFGLVFSGSTHGNFGVGLSLLGLSFLPFLP